MGTKAHTANIAETTAVDALDARTLLGFANLDPNNNVYISDEQGKCNGGGGYPVFPNSSREFEENDGSELKKAWYINADADGTPVRIIEQFKKTIPTNGPNGPKPKC